MTQVQTIGKKTTKPPFRADQVGSLLRSERIKEARKQKQTVH